MSTRFDFILDPQGKRDNRAENKVVEETASFAVVPSLGSLVPGWLLIVPKRPMLNLRSLNASERNEIATLSKSLSLRLKDFGGAVYAFEHGSTSIGGVSGCGVDQAHLHLVPLSVDVWMAALRQPLVRWETRSNVEAGSYAGSEEGEYLSLYELTTRRALVGYPQRPTSQWFRRLIAAELGRPDDWNYRLNDGAKNINLTLEAFA